MTLQTLILITVALVLLAFAINRLHYFLLTRKVISRGSYFNYPEYYDAMKMLMALRGGISLSEVQMRQGCTEKQALVFVNKYIKDGFLSSKKSGENYEIADEKANYDFRYDIIKSDASASRSITHSYITNFLSCDADIADRILVDLENDGIIGPVDFLNSRLNESEREILVYDGSLEDDDYLCARDFVNSTGKASTSSLQTAFHWAIIKLHVLLMN